MASPYLQIDQLTALATQGGYSENPHLSQMSAVLLLSACWFIRERWLWQSPIAPITDATYQNILEMIEQAESDLMTQYAVGSIIPSICEQNAPNLLWLNGQVVSQSDYPQLAACVPSGWISGANINLPDMTDAGLFGTDDNLQIGGFIGENSVALSESEIPAHTHTQNPHQHGYVQGIGSVALGGEIPATASIVTPTPATTGPATATNNLTGGDQPHNNIQRSMLTYYYIVAG